VNRRGQPTNVIAPAGEPKAAEMFRSPNAILREDASSCYGAEEGGDGALGLRAPSSAASF
jgi:hypothetical protein